MSDTTPYFGVPFIRLRDNFLFTLNLLIEGKNTGLVTQPSQALVSKLSGLTEAERSGLRAQITIFFDHASKSFLAKLDEATSAVDGLSISFARKPVATEENQLAAAYESWISEFAVFDKTGNEQTPRQPL